MPPNTAEYILSLSTYVTMTKLEYILGNKTEKNSKDIQIKFRITGEENIGVGIN